MPAKPTSIRTVDLKLKTYTKFTQIEGYFKIDVLNMELAFSSGTKEWSKPVSSLLQ